MTSIAKETVSDFIILEAGVHLAICDAVVDIGRQATPFGDKEHVWIRFEVPAERVSYKKNGVDVDEPQIIWTRYSKNLHKKATLRADLEAWRGTQFTAEELAGFDLFNLVGKPAQIVVVHKASEDRTFANIAAISRCKKGLDIPAQELDSIRFSPDDTDDWELVPEWLQKKFDERIVKEDNVVPIKAPDDEPLESDFHDDDIPF